jgi:hypothetical protein
VPACVLPGGRCLVGLGANTNERQPSPRRRALYAWGPRMRAACCTIACNCRRPISRNTSGRFVLPASPPSGRIPVLAPCGQSPWGFCACHARPDHDTNGGVRRPSWPPSDEEQQDAKRRNAIFLLQLRSWLRRKRSQRQEGPTQGASRRSRSSEPEK